MEPFPQTWTRSFEAVAQDPGLVVVVGASNSGKTTWVQAAAEACGPRDRTPLAIVDADIGQSTIGPPATVALTLLRERPGPGRMHSALPCQALAFIGAMSPLGHLLQLLVATKALVEKALRFGASIVLVDTTGLVEQGAGFQLKLRKIDLLAPKHLIALQRSEELEPLLTVLKDRPGLTIHRLDVSPFARVRMAAERARYRAGRLASYFARAKVLTLEASKLTILSSPTRHPHLSRGKPSPLLRPEMLRDEGFTGTLVGLNDAANETLGIGVFQLASEDANEIRILTPLEESTAVRILQMGSVRLTQSGEGM